MPDKPQDTRVAGNLIFDTLATLVAFLVFFAIARPHVPSADPMMINFWGAVTAACMAGVFWFALQMFKVVLRGQREERQSRK